MLSDFSVSGVELDRVGDFPLQRNKAARGLQHFRYIFRSVPEMDRKVPFRLTSRAKNTKTPQPPLKARNGHLSAERGLRSLTSKPGIQALSVMAHK